MIFSFIIRFLKTKNNKTNPNLYWLKSHSTIKFIMYLEEEVKKKCLEVGLLWKPWYNYGITVIEGFTSPSALLNRHHQYLNGDVWNNPLSTKVARYNTFPGSELRPLPFLIWIRFCFFLIKRKTSHTFISLEFCYVNVLQGTIKLMQQRNLTSTLLADREKVPHSSNSDARCIGPSIKIKLNFEVWRPKG